MRRRSLIILAAVVCAALLASGAGVPRRYSPPDIISDFKSDVSSNEKKIAGSINHLRLKSGVNLLNLDYELCKLAKARAEKYLPMQSYADNIEGLGTLSGMVSGAGLKSTALDEYVSRSSPEKAVSNWASSGGESITDKKFTHVGCGIASDGGKNLVVVIFAALDLPPTPTPKPSPTITPTPSPTAVPSSTAPPAPTEVPSATAAPEATDAPSDTPVPGASRTVNGTPTEAETEFLGILNKQRSSNGVRELRFEQHAQKAAQFRAWEVADTAKYSSDSPAYGDLKSVLKAFETPYKTCAQALTRGNGGAVSAYNALIKSSTYRKILMSDDYAYIGIGISTRENERIYVIYFTN